MDKYPLGRLQRGVIQAQERLRDHSRWLLDFAYLDLSQLDRKAVVALKLEIIAFAATEHKIPEEHRDNAVFFVYAILFFGLAERGSLLPVFQSEVKKRFDECNLGGVWRYDRPGPTERFSVFSREFRATLPNETDLDFLLGAATDLVKRERERFGICQNKGCKKMFVAERKNRAKFCNPKCSALVRVHRSRAKAL